MVVPQTLRVLHVEDDSCDALLVSRELQRGGLSVFVERVDTEAAFTVALKERDWDLILADERLPASAACARSRSTGTSGSICPSS